MRRLIGFLCVLFISSASVFAGEEETFHLRVFAGEYDRQDAVVTFPFAPNVSGAWVVQNEDGEVWPVQLEGGNAVFIFAGEMAARETVDLALKNIGEPDPTAPWVEVLPESGRLRLSVDGTPVAYYQAEERPFPREGLNPRVKRGGFLHPVMTPEGNVVTQSYAKLHPHHQGIWTAWTRTRFEGRHVDYWNMQEGRGKVEFVSLENTWSGPVVGGFVSRHQYVDMTADARRIALNEIWKVNVFRIGNQEAGSHYHLFELNLFQEPPADMPMELPEYHYGGLGFRGPDSWMGADNTSFLTSEGVSDRIEGHGTRTRWTHIGGIVNGEKVGIAILGHPENFRAPQPVRLHPTEPFFCYAPSQLGDWSITKEEPYRARYRFVVADGAPDPELIERIWSDFAHPVQVEILD